MKAKAKVRDSVAFHSVMTYLPLSASEFPIL